MSKKKCALSKGVTKWPILEESVANWVLEHRLNGLIVPRNSNYYTHLEEEYANYRKPPDSADTFQCNNRIVKAQRKHLDDFLRGRIIGRLECGRTQLEVSNELGIAQSVIYRLWQRFQDDGNVSRCYSTGRPELQRRMRTGIFGSYCQKKQTEHSIRPVSPALSSYRYDSFNVDRVQTLMAHWSICS
ncbi:uncharacterized protein TNCV_312911 [Trichonephila clavipes]|nr:uncharacterized protein TNCV_312911 [Trichonephila clavipes]